MVSRRFPEVDILEAQVADGPRAGGMHGGKRQYQVQLRVGRRGDGLVDVVALQRCRHSVGVAADADAGGGISEDGSASAAVLKQ